MAGGIPVEKLVKIQEEIIEVLEKEKKTTPSKLFKIVKQKVREVNEREFAKAVEELERGYLLERIRGRDCNEHIKYRLA